MSITSGLDINAFLLTRCQDNWRGIDSEVKPTKHCVIRFTILAAKLEFFTYTVKLGYNEQLGTDQICSL